MIISDGGDEVGEAKVARAAKAAKIGAHARRSDGSVLLLDAKQGRATGGWVKHRVTTEGHSQIVWKVAQQGSRCGGVRGGMIASGRVGRATVGGGKGLLELDAVRLERDLANCSRPSVGCNEQR